MTKLFLLLTALLLTTPHPARSPNYAHIPPAQDVKVATWTTGAPDTDNFESFAFWIKDNKRAYIRYLHGRSPDDIELHWLGPDSIGSRRGFKAAFPAPDNRTLFIAPVNDSTLLVVTRGQGKKYYWENENANPESDCDICAVSAIEATMWLRRYFWN